MQHRFGNVRLPSRKLVLESHNQELESYNSLRPAKVMKPYLEHIAASTEGSWTLFDRRLPTIPFEWHYNSEYELTLTLNSRGQRFVGDNMAPYDDGDLVLIGPKIPHTWSSSGDCGRGPTHQAIVLWFSEAFVQNLIHSYVELRPIAVLLEASARAIEFSKEVRAKASRIIRAMLKQTAENRLPALLQLLPLLAHDSQARPLTSPPVNALANDSEERIGRVVSYLHDHYREQTAVSQLGRIAALSRSSLHRLFKQQTGMTTSEYVSRLRVGNACALLIGTDHSISLIADKVGYRNLANFNRKFKEIKGKSPREFRGAFHSGAAETHP